MRYYVEAQKEGVRPISDPPTGNVAVAHCEHEEVAIAAALEASRRLFPGSSYWSVIVFAAAPYHNHGVLLEAKDGAVSVDYRTPRQSRLDELMAASDADREEV